MKKKLILIVTIAIALVLLFVLAYAQAPRQQQMKTMDKLNLTDDQNNSLKDIQYNFQKTVIGLRADMQSSRLELRHLMMQDKPDQNAIANLVDKIGETQKKLLKQRIDKRLAMKAVLTPDQFQKFMQMRGDRMGSGMMGGGRGERMKGMRGRGQNFPKNRSMRSGSCPFNDGFGI
jgi:Spy/CpxP family protein refolding chaperone